jgi:hypothetical protein
MPRPRRNIAASSELVDEHIDDAGKERTFRRLEIRARDRAVHAEHPPVHRERGEDGERVVEDVERPDVPGLSFPEPFRDVLGDRDQRREGRSKQEPPPGRRRRAVVW